MSTEQRSSEACPRCGEHRLKLVEPPDLEMTNVQVANDTLGIATDVRLQGEPAIECLACGTEWPGLAAFRSEQADGRPPARDDATG